MAFVYALTNPAFPHLLKIGFTTRPVYLRLSELESTGVPASYAAALWIEVDEAADLEKRIHTIFSDRRFNARREFFQLSLKEFVQEILRMVDGGLRVRNVGGVNADLFPSGLEPPERVKRSPPQNPAAQEVGADVNHDRAEYQAQRVIDMLTAYATKMQKHSQ